MCLICCDEKSISPSPLCHSHSDLFVFLGREGASLVAQGVNNLPAMQETWVQSLSLEDSPGGGNGYPLQYSCPENSMGKGAWRAAVHAITDSDVTEHTRPHAQNRSVSCDQKQPRRECRSTQEAGTGSLGSSCLPTRGSLQTTICPSSAPCQLTVTGRSVTLSLSREVQGCKPSLSLRNGNMFPIKGISSPSQQRSLTSVQGD